MTRCIFSPTLALTLGVGLLLSGPSRLYAQVPSAAQEANTHQEPAEAGRAEEPRDERFKNLVTNMRLSGYFSVDGQAPGEFSKDEYMITSATKLAGTEDLWALTSRIKYGDVDLTVPVPVLVKWAGSTPVITVEEVSIPGLGTFSARVVLDGRGRYAGTWSHDETGGHLFGAIEPVKREPQERR
jgi:hypothetical protein